ncbi:MAG TPA: SIMPL domain-containing protein [Thermoanaerobaculia bacterium]|nr:SIMPL domain-containing protein [Thermoanaerobaculia bacterium]
MKSFVLFILLAAAPLSAQTVTQAPRETGTPETISVTGTGRATLTPDRFSFTAGVQSTAPTVEEAVNENNSKMTAVIAALKRAGATDAEVRTSNFSIYPQQVYQQGQPPRVTGYQVNNSVTVTKSDIAAASKLLQVAIGAGVNETSGLNFEVSNPARGRDDGLSGAFEDAHAKAALLARAAGRTLGRALMISEGTEVQPPPVRAFGVMAAKAEAGVSAPPVESGTRELTYTISVVFEMH